MSDFERDIQQAVQSAIVKTLASGDWLTVHWKDRFGVSPERLREVYNSVDMDKVTAIIKEKIEKRIADSLFNALATEIATDVKKIMCNTELREDCRAVIRTKLRGMQ